MDSKRYFLFAAINPDISGSIGFTSFTDLDGNHYRAINGYTPYGVPRDFGVTFTEGSGRIYKAGKNQKVTVLINGKPDKADWLLADYLRKCSLCEGSPNFRGSALYRELDEEKDASVLIDTKRLRKKANDAAFDLEGKPKELAEVAQLIGEFRDNKDLQFSAVIAFAEANPRQFLEIVEAPDRQARALLKKAISIGEVKEKGKLLIWRNETLGSDEDEAIQKLTKEKEVFKALELSVKKLK